ncbi:hypothetical protein GPK34_03740 [Secundilactobacillus kimchicus]|uniref:hypothetical protein n=1 Tax=Secundilactobacillus kimchicus TaxID=528209 RepID=UPI001C01AB4B|nr:hypothetical protein [Secundilactobacillus kimchicus]MBT9671142.1 hypothetical protein [Secundilactobacillus kimchicus]
MSSHIILAAANAPMAKFFETQGFDSLYVNQESVANQLLATTDEPLAVTEYVQYLKCLRATTTVRMLADAAIGSDPISTTINRVSHCGMDTIVISDDDENHRALTLADFSNHIQAASSCIASLSSSLMLNLGHLEQYGYQGLSERIKLTKNTNVTAIVVSHVTPDDLGGLAPLLAENHQIGLALDHPDFSYGMVQAMMPAFILDTYHPSLAAKQSVQNAGNSVIAKLFMG